MSTLLVILINQSAEVFSEESGKEKIVWHDQVNSHDKTIKGPNQIHKRFAELFPKVKKMRETRDTNRMGQFYLESLGKTASTASTLRYNWAVASTTASTFKAVFEAVFLTGEDVEAVEAVLGETFFYDFLVQELKKQFSGLSPDLQHKLMNGLTNLINTTGSDSSTESPNDSLENPKFVRFEGEVFKVISINNYGKITLGKSGMGNRVYGDAHLSQCKIIE